MREKRILSAVACFLTVVFALLVAPVTAKNKADIVDVQVEQKTENLEVSFRLLNCFTPKMEEAVHSGVRTTFRIRVLLENSGFHLTPGGDTILDTTLEHTIKYNHLKEEYRVETPETPDRVRVTKSLDQAKAWMSQVDSLPLIPLWRLQKDRPYQLKLKAELSKVRLPFFLRYLFYFVSLWDFETDWQKATFTL